MKLAHLPAIAALVLSLGASTAFAAEVTTGATGAATGTVGATVGGTSVGTGTDANAGGSVAVDTNNGVNATGNVAASGSTNTNANSGLGDIDIAGAGTTEASRSQFIASLTAQQSTDLKKRCQDAGLTGASTDVTNLDPSAKALCLDLMKKM